MKILLKTALGVFVVLLLGSIGFFIFITVVNLLYHYDKWLDHFFR